MPFVYVILHYKTLQLTIDCVNTLRQLSQCSHVVIVDNGSCDGSGQRLQEIFSGDAFLHVIISGQNLGFARGNNLGYAYARQNLNPDYIVVMNNDVIISQKDFQDNSVSYIQKNRLDVCGPDILTPDGHHQNPLMQKPFPTFRIIKQIVIDSVRLLCLKLHIFQNRILGTYRKVSSQYHEKVLEPADSINCIVHGACVIFGKRWIEHSEFAFLPVTFLYGEEMILYDFCKRHGFVTGVCASAKVLHLGGKSTMADANERSRQLFKISQTLRSMIQLVRLRLFGDGC